MRLIRRIVAVLVLLCATSVQAEGNAPAGYTLLNPPQPTTSGGKIEVLEFFFYGCSHCFHLHPELSKWEKKKPKDVSLQLVPVIFRDTWEPMARTFYALESMGQRERLHDDLFRAWNVFNTDLSDEAKITEFVAARGIDRARFGAAYNSFSMGSKVVRSNQLVQNNGIRGTPTIVVDGKYVITGLQPDETIRVLDEVIKIARKERSKH